MPGIRRRPSPLAGLVLTLALAGCEGMDRPPLRADLVEAGRAYARANCAQCHGIGRVDDSPLAEAPPFRRLRERYPVEQLAEALAEGIVVGHKEMPAFALSPPEIEALLAYLASLENPRE